MTDTSRAAPALRSGSGAPPAPSVPAHAVDRWLGVLGLAPDRGHALRIRKRVPLSRSLVGEVGVATDLRTGAVTRHAALTADVSIKGRPLAAVRITPRAVQASRAFTLSLPGGIALALRGVAGLTSAGAPVFGIDVDSVSPPPVVAAAAAGLLAAGKPLAGAKAVPLLTTRVPGLYDPWTVLAEVRACVQKKGGGLLADLRELNFVLDV